MDFSPSPRATDLAEAVRAFVTDEIIPLEAELHTHSVGPRDTSNGARAGFNADPRIAELQDRARELGLWNLFLPADHTDAYDAAYLPEGGALNNTEYAVIAEQTGRSAIAPLIMNCNAPDTGNMEVLIKYGSDTQRRQWLDPLLRGDIRSAFLMTEPDVAGADATTMSATAILDGDDVVLNGRKWWSTGAGHPDCAVGIFMGLTYPDADRHARHSMVLVPFDSPGFQVERMLTALGQYDEPLGHAEISLTDVRVPADNILAGPGRAFDIAQGRLGPGRVHHCMRLIGLAERALELALERSTSRTAFGKPLAMLGGNREKLAEARIALNAARLLVLNCAWKLDTVGIAGALSEVSEIKAHVPKLTCDIIDMTMQLHGGAGLSEDFPLAAAYSWARALRLADGPDEVHLGVVARHMLKPYR